MIIRPDGLTAAGCLTFFDDGRVYVPNKPIAQQPFAIFVLKCNGTEIKKLPENEDLVNCVLAPGVVVSCMVIKNSRAPFLHKNNGIDC
jgi:hypothetical protein